MKKPIIQIIRKSNDKYQIIKSLKQNRKKRNAFKEIYIEGIESIKQAISANILVKKVIFADYDKLSNWSKEIIGKIYYEELIQLESGLYKDLSDKSDPAELIITIKYEKIKIDEIELKPNPFILIFDRPSDNGNLGSLIRSAN
ncbi:MAG: RNA methyltransferase, partial [Candidatus Cloacimonetes bacterium]|nr:RNA methyltransferase [Candidatus Cloacimonadota bacterium]